MSVLTSPPPPADVDDTLLAETGWQALVLHDLRAPLTVVVGQVQMLRRQLRSGSADDALPRLDSILRCAGRMVSMLEELQDLAQSADGTPAAPRLQRVDLVELTRGVVAEYAVQAPEHTVAVLAGESSIVGRWDAGRLERALGNLIGNAVKYSPDAGQIRVAVWRERRATGDRAVVSVRDQGLGIPAEDVAHVFERFYRGGNVVRGFAGAGLGLASVKQVVDQHHGTVDIESLEGVGTTFTLRLPLTV